MKEKQLDFEDLRIRMESPTPEPVSPERGFISDVLSRLKKRLGRPVRGKVGREAA